MLLNRYIRCTAVQYGALNFDEIAFDEVAFDEIVFDEVALFVRYSPYLLDSRHNC